MSRFLKNLHIITVILGTFLVMAGCSSDDPAALEEDKTPPGLSSVAATGPTELTVVFDEKVDPATSVETANYAISETATPANTVAVLGAALETDGKTVMLSTDPLTPGQSYTLDVTGVADLKGNVLSSTTTKAVEDWIYSYGTITLWGGEPGRAAFDGDGNTPLDSKFYFPVDLIFTSTGCYLLDWNNHRLRHLTNQNTFETVMGTDLLGDGDPDLLDRVQPVPGNTIDLNHPTGVMELPNGNLLLSCWHNHKLREYDPTTGMAWVTVGAAADFGGDGGPARDGLLNFPVQTVQTDDGTIYLVDQRNVRVRKITGGPNPVITTICGTGLQGFGGDGGPPEQAVLNFPLGNNPPVAGALALDADENLYIADTDNHRIRKIDFQTNMITTIAGDGIAGYSGDGGDAKAASLNYPGDIEFGPDGRLYIADQLNNRIRAVDLATGIIVTVAGNGTPGYGGDGGSAAAAMINRPWGIEFDGDVMYISDTFNHVIRKVTP